MFDIMCLFMLFHEYYISYFNCIISIFLILSFIPGQYDKLLKLSLKFRETASFDLSSIWLGTKSLSPRINKKSRFLSFNIEIPIIISPKTTQQSNFQSFNQISNFKFQISKWVQKRICHLQLHLLLPLSKLD